MAFTNHNLVSSARTDKALLVWVHRTKVYNAQKNWKKDNFFVKSFSRKFFVKLISGIKFLPCISHFLKKETDIVSLKTSTHSHDNTIVICTIFEFLEPSNKRTVLLGTKKNNRTCLKISTTTKPFFVQIYILNRILV